MYRKQLAELLRERPRTLEGLARELRVSPRDLEQDLLHLRRSLARGEDRLKVEPARCRKCEFGFRADKLGKPGRCPECRSTWIEPAAFWVEPR